MLRQNFAVVCMGKPAGLSMTITLASSNSTSKCRGTSGSTGAGRCSRMVSPARTGDDGRAVRPSGNEICSPMIDWMRVRDMRPMRRLRK